MQIQYMYGETFAHFFGQGDEKFEDLTNEN